MDYSLFVDIWCVTFIILMIGYWIGRFDEIHEEYKRKKNELDSKDHS